MKTETTNFIAQKEYVALNELLENWEDGPQKMKSAFMRIKDKLLNKENTILSLISRPGVSYSLRASRKNSETKNRRLFALVDIIDDDPKNRWLSICFYVDTITDPEEIGNLVPKGILGEDGYCFDLYERNESMFSYIEQRVDEAHAHIV